MEKKEKSQDLNENMRSIKNKLIPMQPNGMVPRVYGDGHREGYLRWYRERFLYNCEVSLGGYVEGAKRKGYRVVRGYNRSKVWASEARRQY